jgi:hypothetical protein
MRLAARARKPCGKGGMNAVEIEEAISALAERPFDAGEFPFAFLQAFGNKETTLKRASGRRLLGMLLPDLFDQHHSLPVPGDPVAADRKYCQVPGGGR